MRAISPARPMWRRSAAATLRRVNPLVVYLVLAAIAVGFALSAMILTRPLRRTCPGCDCDVRMDALACRSCGYRFA